MPSAATTNIATSTGEYVRVTGTTNISSFGTGFVGCKRQILFPGVLTLQHSVNLYLPGSVNLTTAANDVYSFRCFASGQWILVSGSRVSDPLKANLVSPSFTGTPLSNGIEIGYRGIPYTA